MESRLCLVLNETQLVRNRIQMNKTNAETAGGEYNTRDVCHTLVMLRYLSSSGSVVSWGMRVKYTVNTAKYSRITCLWNKTNIYTHKHQTLSTLTHEETRLLYCRFFLKCVNKHCTVTFKTQMCYMKMYVCMFPTDMCVKKNYCNTRTQTLFYQNL